MSRFKYLKTISAKELTLTRLNISFRARIKNIPHAISWVFSKRSKLNKIKLYALKNKHNGERCFIVANGPSLNLMDLSLLKNETVIAMNRMYMNSKEMGFPIAYLVVSDIETQLSQFTKDYQKVPLVRFYNWNYRSKFKDDIKLHFIKSDFRVRFSKNVVIGCWGGHSVTYTCLQLAYYLGFDEVILIGKDHSYSKSNLAPGELVKSTGNEENHFTRNYFKPGMVWKVPDYKGEELAYSMAKEAFEKDGRKVFDATIDGKLDIFSKIDYYDIF